MGKLIACIVSRPTVDAANTAFLSALCAENLCCVVQAAGQPLCVQIRQAGWLAGSLRRSCTHNLLTNKHTCQPHNTRHWLTPTRTYHLQINTTGGPTALFSGSLYAMTKAALNQLTKNLAVEWAADGIRVNSVAPWWVWGGGCSDVCLQLEGLGMASGF